MGRASGLSDLSRKSNGEIAGAGSARVRGYVPAPFLPPINWEIIFVVLQAAR